jgi:hypothetical protein
MKKFLLAVMCLSLFGWAANKREEPKKVLPFYELNKSLDSLNAKGDSIIRQLKSIDL